MRTVLTPDLLHFLTHDLGSEACDRVSAVLGTLTMTLIYPNKTAANEA